MFSPPIWPKGVDYLLSAACATAFLSYLPFRLLQLRKHRPDAAPVWGRLLQPAIAGLLVIVLFGCLVKRLSGQTSWLVDTSAVISLSASLAAALGLSVLLFLETRRSTGPSDPATLYLLGSLGCDLLLLGLPTRLDPVSDGFEAAVVVRFCLYATLLISQAAGNRSFHRYSGLDRSPEEYSGLLGRLFFTWIIPMLVRGYKHILVHADLPPLRSDMSPELTRHAIIRSWEERTRPKTKYALLWALWKCLCVPFLAAIIPRLFLIVFRYAQPLLIRQAIRFVTMPANSLDGYWLVVSVVVIYLGLALSTGVYQHLLNRLRLMTKSALIGLIHHHMIHSPSAAYDDGVAITLMSTDVDGLEGTAEMLHETWAQCLEVLIGIALLAREVGWIWPLPLALIYLCSHMSRYVARHLQGRQTAWNTASQSRIAATSNMLAHMKVVKMLGLQQQLAGEVQSLRQAELSAAGKVRWMMVWYNASANALGIFSPAITLVLYAVIATTTDREFDTETAFSTVAILGLVTHPANMVMTIVPRGVAAFAGVTRIQNFLLKPSLHDRRSAVPRSSADGEARTPAGGRPEQQRPAIKLTDLTIGEPALVLEDINITFMPGTLTIICGPVGCGKSSLLRAILGETAPVRGLIDVSTKCIAYCAQRPWLPSGSIKEVICGYSDTPDEQWYAQVVDACCLGHDLEALPERDMTQIGSRGFNLSGGQRQRVALARAVFARCQIALLDDTLSSLDGKTEQQVLGNLFGREGVFRALGTTVILVSNSIQHFPKADHLVLLGNRRVVEQGPWQSLLASAAMMSNPMLLTENERKMSAPPTADLTKLQAQFRARDDTAADLSRKTGDFALYDYYFRFIGLANLLLVLAGTASYSIFITVPQLWLAKWTESSSGSTFWYTAGYMVLSMLSWSSTSATLWATLIRVAPQSGAMIHQRLLDIITNAPLSYFSATDNGSTLNRFSQDIQLIDKQLPVALNTVEVQLFKLIMQAILLFMAQKYLSLSLPGCMILLYVVQRVYLQTSRQLRFLELESRATVFANFLESLEGLETIRAFGWSDSVVRKTTDRVGEAQRPEYLLLSLQRWLNIVLDLVAAGLATGVIILAVRFRDKISGGQIGVALNIMLVVNSTLLKLVKSWTTLEVSLGAVSRLKSLETTVQPEGRVGEDYVPPSNWPSQGRIEIRGITAAYRTDAAVLRDISLTVKPGQRLTLTGRTGSGKSSFILTLLRMLEIQKGTIEIDGIDITLVPRSVIRQRCFVTVSQDAFILPASTLRINLDPYARASDDIIVAALEKTKLWEHFTGLSITTLTSTTDTTTTADPPYHDHPLLSQPLSSLPSLSVGQTQLFALCRALVKVHTLREEGVQPIILLDEVTSSLDAATEAIIHDFIDLELTRNGHTVIVIAHRLGVLANHARPGQDVVVRLRDGKVEAVGSELNAAVGPSG